MSSDAGDIFSMLAGEFKDQSEAGAFDPDLDDFMETEVVPVWRDNAPEDSGHYEELVQVTQPAQGGKGQVSATADYSNIVEYGSEDTPEFAPMRRTVEQINGRSS